MDIDAVRDVDALLDAIEARALRWGIVTNKATRYTTPLLEQLGLVARRHGRLRRHDAASRSRTRRR